MEKRCSFELFKSNVCHWLKEEGDIDFLIQVLESDLIRKYYDDLRQQKMQKMIYPVGILITASVLSDDSVKEDAVKHAIPEFLSLGERNTPFRKSGDLQKGYCAQSFQPV